MTSRKEGLTAIYNRFHNPTENDENIDYLRLLQVDMDRLLTNSYGWADLNLAHGFHETKQGLRFTISESARRMILDRLLALNHQRYEEEVAAGLHDKKAGTGKRGSAKKKLEKSMAQGELL
jgi:hypothetical protein